MKIKNQTLFDNSFNKFIELANKKTKIDEEFSELTEQIVNIISKENNKTVNVLFVKMLELYVSGIENDEELSFELLKLIEKLKNYLEFSKN